ncbi:MAG: hypothetical protein O2856_17395, partial [Planctomycetota bacterium]|nr:hypothetical protein [Planctomycetota bacterium]
KRCAEMNRTTRYPAIGEKGFKAEKADRHHTQDDPPQAGRTRSTSVPSGDTEQRRHRDRDQTPAKLLRAYSTVAGSQRSVP